MNMRGTVIAAWLAVVAGGVGEGRAGADAWFFSSALAQFGIEGWAERQENDGDRDLKDPPRQVRVRVGGSGMRSQYGESGQSGDWLGSKSNDKTGVVESPGAGTFVLAAAAAWGHSRCNQDIVKSGTAAAWIEFTNTSRNRTFVLYYETSWGADATAGGNDPTKDVAWSMADASVARAGDPPGLAHAEAHYPAAAGDVPHAGSPAGGNFRPMRVIGPGQVLRWDLTASAKGEAKTVCTPAPGGAAVIMLGGVMVGRRRRG